jgi:hypothetical protein
VKETYDRAIEVLRRNCMERGIRASTDYYNQVWARDSFITFLGANMLEDEQLTSCAKASLRTFSGTRSRLGQIANFFDLRTKAPEFGFSGSTDSSCWYIIGLASLYAATGDRTLLREPLEAALDAYRWLRYQDANNTWLIDSPQGADWMDAAVQRTGKTVYNNVLFLIATRCMDKLLSSSGRSMEGAVRLDFEALRQRFTEVFLPDAESPARVGAYWPRLSQAFSEARPMGFSQRHYLQYISFNRIDVHFDTLSNLLCVLSGVADTKTALSILTMIRAKGLSKPYPVKVLHPPYRAEGASYDTNFDSSVPIQHRSTPYAYHNGGVWPFVGGFYVCALNMLGVDCAEREEESLARANNVFREGETTGFNEWIHAKTGRALGQFGQSWSAGMFAAAVLSAKGRNPLVFLE